MASSPNIIFLISDQMQQKAVMDPRSLCQMPHLRLLQQDGITFERAHTVNPICSPARASLITGVLPHTHGMVDCTHTVPAYRAEFDDSLWTLPQAIKDQGYTLAYYGKWHIERSNDLGKFGFTDYETEVQIPKRDLTPVKRVVVKTPGYKDSTVAGVYREDSTVSEEHYIYDRAMGFMDQAGDQPFCVFISTYAPHDPYVIPEEIYDIYKGSIPDFPASMQDTFDDKPFIYNRLKQVWKDLSDEEILDILRCYYGYCSLVDVQIGRLTEYLKAKNLYDNTIIVFLSDHGDMVGGHGMFCKGVPAFDEVYRIPLVMKLPNQELCGQTRDVFADTCDILPTVLSLAGIPWKGGELHGQDLLDPNIPPKEFGYAEFHGQRYSYTQRVVWYQDMKYVFNTFDRDELYDLSKDPDELHNLIDDADYQQAKEQMAALMWRRVIETNDWSLRDAQYFMHRFAPVGPQRQSAGSDFNLYNKSF
ncbi:MAG: sulfatase-like hydrolase/transferase [Lachnospiraceae bacterium]|nr:sulfatase-like hydrolase/transferase [Lachnospiraceae bacterium]